MSGIKSVAGICAIMFILPMIGVARGCVKENFANLENQVEELKIEYPDKSEFIESTWNNKRPRGQHLIDKLKIDLKSDLEANNL